MARADLQLTTAGLRLMARDAGVPALHIEEKGHGWRIYSHEGSWHVHPGGRCRRLGRGRSKDTSVAEVLRLAYWADRSRLETAARTLGIEVPPPVRDDRTGA